MKHCKSVLGTFGLLLLAALLVANAAGQSLQTGDITGVITDPSGAVVPGATVVLTSKDTGQSKTATTNGVGSYRFSLQQPGAYTLKVTGQNYQPATREARVAVGQASTINVQLALQSQSQEVTVTAEGGIVQTDNPNLATTMSSEQVHLVPNGGGDLSYVAQTAPGAAMNSEGGFGNFSTFGLPAISNNFTYNSMPENDPFLNLNNSGATNILLGQNDVSEATVVNNGYSGEYSMAGANVNYVSRSGSNAFHGNANYYWNGRLLNANNYFNNQSTPPVSRGFVNDNQWAASFGGPIQKNKTFFFVDTEGLRLIIPVNDSINVPSPSFEVSTLANIAGTQPSEVGFYQNMFNIWNSAPGASGAANNLAGGGCADFAGAGFGAGNPCALSYHRSVPDLTTEWLITARVDHNFGDNDKAFVHFRRDYGVQATYTDPVNSAFNITSKQPQYEGQLQETHTFSPTTVNSAVISASYYRAIFTQANQAAALALTPLQVSFPGQSSTTSGTFWSLGNQYQSPFPTPQGRNATQYGFVDDISHTRGAHTFKAGMNFARYDITDFAPGVNSLPALSGESLTDFFNGVGTSFTQAFPTRLTEPIALYHLGFYGSDDWQVKSNLKLTLSLRADRSSNPVCRTNCFSTLAAPFSSVDHSLTTPYNQTVLAGRSNAIPGDYHSWELEPRVGFNWAPFGATTGTVFSGGFGIFSDIIPAGFVDSLIRDLPGDPAFTLPGFPFAPNVPGNAQSAAAAAAGALQNGFFAGANWAALNSAVLASTGGVSGFAPPNFFNVGANMHVPRFQEWDLQVQQAFGQKTSLSVRYVGNHGIHEQILNPAVNAYCGSTVSSTAVLSAGAGGVPAPCLTQLGFSSFAGLPSVQPDQRFLQVAELSTGYTSNYNGMTLSLARRMSSLQFQFNYTWSHALDFSSNNGVGGNGEPFNIKSNLSVSNPQNPTNPFQNMYGNADYDIRHYVSMNYVWTVPTTFTHGLLRNVLGNWTIAGTAFWHTGLPFSVVDLGTGTTLAGFGFGGVTGAGIFPTLANQTSTGAMSCDGRSANPVNGPCAALINNFTADLNGFGNQRRNQVYGPGFFDSDLSLMKNFKLPRREGMSLSVGATAYNIFNHPNFDQPVGFIGTSTYGTIVSTVNAPTSIYGSFLNGDASPRLWQLQAKFNF